MDSRNSEVLTAIEELKGKSMELTMKVQECVYAVRDYRNELTLAAVARAKELQTIDEWVKRHDRICFLKAIAALLVFVACALAVVILWVFR